MKHKVLGWACLCGFAVALVASAPLAPTARAADTCGSKDNPCPMQKWMRSYVGTPMQAKDLAGVAAGLEKAADLVKDGAFPEWAALSKAGANAARQGDLGATKASCKDCHDKYKDSYKAKLRTKAVP